jgi:predicted TIM-barrel fold metal-dependent hydrolase
MRNVCRQLLLLTACAGLCWCARNPPKLIDCHVHHNGSNQFLERLVAKLDSMQGMAMLITEPKDLDSVTSFMKTHPDRLIGLGQIELDAPDALQTIDRFHAAGFRGLGELTKPQYSYDDRRYWPIYERAEQYGMIVLFHTGIVNRTNPEKPADVSSDRMRVSTLDLIARRFPKLTIIGAHLGNPDYAWAGEVGRWNPNVYFDVSGSTLIKKQEDYGFFKSIFWWTSVVSPHTPKSSTTAFEKLVFGSDVFEGDLDELDRALERYHHMLDACGVPAAAQANIFSGTLWRILNR